MSNSKRFKTYKKEVRRLLRMAGIGGRFAISFRREHKPDSGCRAWVTTNYMSCVAVFGYNTAVAGCPLESARHEFGHFVVSGLDAMAGDRFVTRDEIHKECESVAMIFQRLKL